MLYRHCFELCFIIMCHQQCPRKSGGNRTGWSTSAPGLCWRC